MPKGHKTPKTLEKEAAREAMCQRVYADLEELVEAQIASALGLKILVVRHKRPGRVHRAADPLAPLKLRRGEEAVEVWTRTEHARFQEANGPRTRKACCLRRGKPVRHCGNLLAGRFG
jgi:hypothetical protein